MKEIKGYTPQQFLHENKRTFSGVNAGNYIEDEDFLNFSMPLYEENIKLLEQVEIFKKAHEIECTVSSLLKEQSDNLKIKVEILREALELITTSPEWIKNYGGGEVDKKATAALKQTEQ